MRILFLGNFEAEYSSENYYLKTFRKMGHEVTTLQEGKTSGRDILKHQTDLFFWVHTHSWATHNIMGVLNHFKSIGVPTVAYHLDLYMGLQRWKEYERGEYFKVQHFFTVDKLMADWLNSNTETKGHFLPAGVYEDECVLGTPNLEKYPHDIIFTGAKGYHREWPYRPKLIEWLQSTYGERFGHYGNGGMAQVRGLELNNLYASAKIVIGDTLCKDFNYPWYSSDRLFEVCGRGGFLIYPEISGLETFYNPAQIEMLEHNDITPGEIVFYRFDDFEQLKYKIDWFLNHDVQRNKTRIRAFEHTKREHTYTHRLTTLLNTIFS